MPPPSFSGLSDSLEMTLRVRKTTPHSSLVTPSLTGKCREQDHRGGNRALTEQERAVRGYGFDYLLLKFILLQILSHDSPLQLFGLPTESWQ